MKGINFILTPRPDGRRGGGVAISFPGTRFNVTKLNVNIPNPLECLFALVRPIQNQAGKLKKILAVCFYSPPRSRKNSQLIDLMTVEISRLRVQHNRCGVKICGDRNDLEIEELMPGDPTLRQIVIHNTSKNKDKVLDVVVTNLYAGYQDLVLLHAVQVYPGRQGVSSDHARLEVKPRTNLSASKARPKKDSFMVLRMPNSLLAGYGPEDWSFLQAGRSPAELVEAFQAYASRLVDQHFIKKLVSVTQLEKPYFIEEVQKLRKQRDCIYQKSGK